MDFVQSIIKQACTHKRSVVYPEGTDARVLEACVRVSKQGIAVQVIIIGATDNVLAAARDINIDKKLRAAIEANTVSIINPPDDSRAEQYARELHSLRKAKGMSEQEAEVAILNPLNFGAMMVRTREVHAMVAGAAHPTADVLRSALTIVRPAEGIKTVSSFFVMEYNNGAQRVIFADCAIIPRPSAEELSCIAYSSAQSCKAVLGEEAAVAMLSFSTKGSAKHEETEKVREAADLARRRHPDIAIDGELQFDAAIDRGVAQSKAPASPVAGKANVFVFPDLAAGNIGYKIAQRIGGANAYGPFIQGLAAPVSDLSRGCSADDIVATTAVMMCSEA